MHKDIVVIGGGVVGLSAALAMAQRGLSVALLDAGALTVAATAVSPRVYAINPASERLLTQLNAWRHCDVSRLSPYQHMHVWDGLKGGCIDFDARMLALHRLGYIVDDAHLKYALLQEIATHPITLLPECKVEKVVCSDTAITIQFADEALTAKRVIVADGAHSAVRGLLGVPVTEWSYQQQALVTTVQTEKPHAKTAYQIFTGDGVLAFLPLSDAHHCSIVWSCASAMTEQRMALESAAFNQQLTEAFQGKLGQVQHISKRYAFPLTMRHVQQYCGHGWLLMGDAAHTIHPLAGLGLNLGLADLSAWCALLDTQRRRVDSPIIGQAYQRQRKHAVWQTIALMEGFKTLFVNTHKSVVTLRSCGLTICNRLPFLKKMFITHAMG